MKKYLSIFSISWSGGFIYRLNFVMWRFRNFLQLLTIYFLWMAIMSGQVNSFGYSQAEMFTYVLGSSFLRSMVFSSRSTDVQSDISSGDLNNYLLKPVSYFRYWFFRDLADKALNVVFSVGEVALMIFLFRPALVLPTIWTNVVLLVVAGGLGMSLYFFFSLIISLSVFWMPESNGWPQRFFIFMILEFLSGGLFPLDILPKSLFGIIAHLPTSYFVFMPMQIYLGKMSMGEIGQSFLIIMGWMVGLMLVAKYLFKRGLKVYGAWGR